MKRFIDDEKKTIWYYSESGFPTYMAISNYRKQNPSYEHSIASKETWEELTKNQKKYDEGWEAAFGKKTKKKDKKKNETRTRSTDCENNER